LWARGYLSLIANLEYLSESKRHQSWKLREIRRRVQSFWNDVFLGEARLLKGVHDQASLKKDAKKLMYRTVKVKLSLTVRRS
jgi:hypothetical protein